MAGTFRLQVKTTSGPHDQGPTPRQNRLVRRYRALHLPGRAATIMNTRLLRLNGPTTAGVAPKKEHEPFVRHLSAGPRRRGPEDGQVHPEHAEPGVEKPPSLPIRWRHHRRRATGGRPTFRRHRRIASRPRDLPGRNQTAASANLKTRQSENQDEPGGDVRRGHAARSASTWRRSKTLPVHTRPPGTACAHAKATTGWCRRAAMIDLRPTKDMSAALDQQKHRRQRRSDSPHQLSCPRPPPTHPNSWPTNACHPRPAEAAFGQQYRMCAHRRPGREQSLISAIRLSRFRECQRAGRQGTGVSEPVDPPVLVHRHRVSEGESLERMVIRSNYDSTAVAYFHVGLQHAVQQPASSDSTITAQSRAPRGATEMSPAYANSTVCSDAFLSTPQKIMTDTQSAAREAGTPTTIARRTGRAGHTAVTGTWIATTSSVPPASAEHTKPRRRTVSAAAST